MRTRHPREGGALFPDRGRRLTIVPGRGAAAESTRRLENAQDFQYSRHMNTGRVVPGFGSWAPALVFAAAIFLRADAGASYPEARENYVNDYAGILGDADAQALRGVLDKLEKETGVEGTVVTVNSVEEYGANSVDAFATGLFNYWGVGDKSKNNGFMILVSMFDKKFRIELGEGYGTRHNAAMRNIAEQTMPPYFRTGNYGAGLRQGTAEVISNLVGGRDWIGWAGAAAVALVLYLSGWRPGRGKSRSTGGFGGGRSSGRGGASGGW